jgi:hypothetical protein
MIWSIAWITNLFYSYYFPIYNHINKIRHVQQHYELFLLSIFLLFCCCRHSMTWNTCSEKIWKIWKKRKLKCEMVWKIWRKSKLNSEKIWKMRKCTTTIVRKKRGGNNLFFTSFIFYLFLLQNVPIPQNAIAFKSNHSNTMLPNVMVLARDRKWRHFPRAFSLLYITQGNEVFQTLRFEQVQENDTRKTISEVFQTLRFEKNTG